MTHVLNVHTSHRFRDTPFETLHVPLSDFGTPVVLLAVESPHSRIVPSYTECVAAWLWPQVMTTLVAVCLTRASRSWTKPTHPMPLAATTSAFSCIAQKVS